MKILVQVQGIKKIQERLKSKSDTLSNLQPFWQLVGEYVVKQTIKERFEKEQTPDGEKWKPLSEARIKQRMKRHKTGKMKILQDTGELRRSIRYQANNNSVVIGSNLKYSRTHQFGRGKIPARRYLGVNDTDKKYISSLFIAYLKHHLSGGG